MVKTFVEMANTLDKFGMMREADIIDSVILRICT